MTESDSRLVENLLAKPEVHEQWEGAYRTDDNERFYEQAFDYIIKVLAPPPNSTILDVGCGPCAHSARLASRGFNVHAVDFSESALKMAAEVIKARGLEDKIKLGRESLLDLSFPDESFDYVLCWGVLMHIPDVERAVSELARVVRRGGILIVSEANLSSLEGVGLRGLKRLLKREKAEIKRTEAGVEYWKVRGDDALVTRQANIDWLIRNFQKGGLDLTKRIAGQFSEAYTLFSARPLQKLVHSFNSFWFKRVRSSKLAFGNILFLRKR